MSAAFAASAGAAYHLVKVREVHKGPAATGDYVMLQMYEAGQNLLAGHYIRILKGDGSVQAQYELTTVPNGQSQRTYLFGNSVPGADRNEAGVFIDPSGAVCYNESGALPFAGIDCVTWGAFTPTVEAPSSLTGNPAAALGANQSLVRTISRGCATALDAADDTDNSVADFALGTPIGRPNAGVPTETLCTTTTTKKKKKKCKKKKAKKGDASAAAKKKKCKKKKKKK